MLIWQYNISQKFILSCKLCGRAHACCNFTKKFTRQINGVVRRFFIANYIMENSGDLTEKFAAAKQLYAVQSYDECSSLVQVKNSSNLISMYLVMYHDCAILLHTKAGFKKEIFIQKNVGYKFSYLLSNHRISDAGTAGARGATGPPNIWQISKPYSNWGRAEHPTCYYWPPKLFSPSGITADRSEVRPLSLFLVCRAKGRIGERLATFGSTGHFLFEYCYN